MDFDAIVRTVQSPLGLAGLLLVILWTGAKRWWVFGWIYEDKKRESEEWKRLALAGTNIAAKVTEALERKR
jgi:hypothetical protein